MRGCYDKIFTLLARLNWGLSLRNRDFKFWKKKKKKSEIFFALTGHVAGPDCTQLGHPTAGRAQSTSAPRAFNWLQIN